MILFVHDHKFRRVNGKIYTTGGLSNAVLQRYLKLDNELCVYARVIDETQTMNQWSLIKENVSIYGNESLSGNQLEGLISKADGIVIRMPSFLGLRACKFAELYHKPCMIEVVGCAWDSLINHGVKGWIAAPYCYLKMKKYVKNAMYVLYVTEQYLQNRYPTRGHSINCSDVEIDDVRSEKSCLVNNHRRILGTIGAVDVRYKGQEYVIEALRLLKERCSIVFEYQIVGNGDASYLKKKARENGVEDRVVFCGGIPHEEIFKWLDSIDIYIQPSQTEGLPRALIEAESRGLPCLGSNVGGIPELLQENAVFDVKTASVANNIANILANLSKSDIDELSKHSVRVASKYKRDLIENRREDFYQAFYHDVLIHKNKD